MPVNYPKFDQKIQDQINNTIIKASKTRPGTIMQYSRISNTATILLDDQFSDSYGNVITSVPCPFSKGIQGVAPTSGTRCMVGFKDNNEMNPYVINYFDDTSSTMNYTNNTIVNTGVPRFMVH